MLAKTSSTTQAQIQKREEWLDVIKAIAIIAIVFSHAGIKTAPISYFYVPLFFFASGYVFKDKGITNFLVRLVKRIYLPFVCANSIVLLLHNILYEFGVWGYKIDIHYMLKAIIKILSFDIVENLMAQCWFLAALFMVNICFYIIHKILSPLRCHKLIIGLITLFLGCGTIILNEKIPQVMWGNCNIIGVSLIGVMFYGMGWILKESGIIDIINKKNNKLYIVLCISLIVLILIKYVFDGNKFDYRAMAFSNYYYIIPAGFGGIITISVFVISAWKTKLGKTILQVFAYIGKHTMPILLFHTIAFQIISIIQIYIFNIDSSNVVGWCHIYSGGSWSIIIGMCGVVIPLCLQWLGEKIFLVKVSNRGTKN